ncbi:MAG: outer membrane lipoprotein-sorting protein [Bacteroidales bacterium]|nr:outer membrane lipoprotein-sorting protein [Bacteroidales bacterium]MCF8396939.1 outer membrane lipoprotein-sorting protein [Bacteroidales bacterium]
MKSKAIITWILALLLLTGNSILGQQPDAKDIVKKATDKLNGESSKGKMSMKIIRPSWTREIEMKVWSLGTEYYMIYITAPAREEGQVFLKRDQDMWNYMPNINRMIKIPPSMMMQSWMGSDFTNNDLVKVSSMVEDYTHKITGQDTIEGFECWIIEFTPKPNAAVVWGKIEMWISKVELYELKALYYDESGKLVNKEFMSDVEQMGDRKLPSHMEMIPVDKEGHKTVMDFVDMEFNVDIGEDFFSIQNMKRVR